MRYTFAAARKLYDNAVHPRVFVGPADITTLRNRIRTGAAKKLMTAIRAKSAPLIERVANADNLPVMIAEWNHKWDNPGTNIMFGLQDIALVGVLDDNADAIDTVRTVLGVLPEAEPLSRPGVRRLGYALPPAVPGAYDLVHAHLSAKERRSYTKWAVDSSIRQPLEMVAKGYLKSAGGNMTWQGMETAIHAMLAVTGDPGVPKLERERALLLRYFEATMRTTIGPDGYPEEDIGYGSGTIGTLGEIGEAIRRAGWFDPYKQIDRYAKMGRAMLAFVQPWGDHLTNTGDHGDKFGHREFILARLATENDDPALLWLLGAIPYTHGVHNPAYSDALFEAEPQIRRGMRVPATSYAIFALNDLAAPPRRPKRAAVPTAYRDRARGIVTFRSGWQDDDAYLTLDASQRSPGAQGHAHQSAGHFNLSAVGECFAIDTGRYCNEQDQHNVVLVDGKSGRDNQGEWKAIVEGGVLTDFAPHTFVDSASVDSAHQHQIIWARRSVGLVKGVRGPSWAWTVDDLNKCHDWAEYWWAVNTSPENTIKLSKDCATITGWRRGNHLDVHLAMPNADDFPKPHKLKFAKDVQTPSSYKYVGDPHEKAKAYPRPAAMEHGPAFVRPRLLAKVQGYNGRFMSIMLPRVNGDKPASVKRLPTMMNSIGITVTFRDVRDTFIWSFEHHLLEADGIVARGKWCVVRRARSTGRVLAHAVAEGHRIEVDGRKLKV